VKSFELSPIAQSDLDRVVGYVMLDSEIAAEQVLDAIVSGFHLIAENPNIGRRRPGSSSLELRTWVVYSYVIVYRPETKPVHVLRIFHGAQDIERLLADIEWSIQPKSVPPRKRQSRST